MKIKQEVQIVDKHKIPFGLVSPWHFPQEHSNDKITCL